MANEFDYMDRILTNQQVSGDQNVLRLDPEASVRATDQRYLSDAYNYFLGGGKGIDPGAAVQVPGTTVNVPGTADQGITYLTETGEPAAGPGTGITAIGGAQNPLTQMVTTPTGETMTVKEAMTQPGAYDIPGTMPLTPVSGAWGPQDYLQPTADQGVTADDAYAYDPSLDSIIDGVPTTFSPPEGGRNISQEEFLTGAAATPTALTAAKLAKDAAGNWLYRGAAPGTKAATQAAARGATAGQIGKAIMKEGAFGVKGKPGGFGSTNVGFDPAYKGAGATGRAGYIGQGLKSLTGAAAAGNIGGGTPAARLAFEKLAQSGAARGLGTLGRVAGLTTPVGAALTAATLTPMAIDALTRREPDATETSLFGMDLQDLEDRAAAYDAGETATLDDWGSPMGDVPDPTVTGITGPAGQQLGNVETLPSGELVYRDPIMDMVAADQGVTADAGFSDADIQTAQSPESKSLLEKVKSGAATAQDYISKYGMAAYNFAKGNMMGGALGLMGGPLGLVPMLGDLQKTNVTPEDRAANAEFEQKNKINIGDDGRITSGPLQGLNPAGKSFAGSANYEEMVDKKIADIKNRKAPQTDASRLKITELEAMKGPETRDARIDEGILAAEDDKGTDMLDIPLDIPTEEEEDITDLMTFEQLGGWLGRDDKVPDEPTEVPTGIVKPTAPEITETRGGGGADVMDTPTTTTTTTPSDGGFGDTPGPRGGGGDPAPSGPTGPTGGPPGGGDPGMRSPSGPPAGGPHGGAPSAPSASTSSPGHPSNRGGGGGGGGSGGCFLKGTPITMADGSTKPVEQVDLGDEIAEGGKVFAAGRFLTEELHDYEGIKVSGSHMVNEDGTWVRVRDSEKGKPLGDDEHTVYVFGAENRRILINGILFTDYFEVKEQDKLATIGDKYFEEWKDHNKILVNLEEQNNVARLNAS